MGAFQGTVLYIGGFELPDRNAGAHRVLSNGKILRQLGFRVVFLGKGAPAASTPDFLKPAMVQGFESFAIFEGRRGDFARQQFDIGFLSRALSHYQDVRLVIAYNYPSLALLRMMRLCRAVSVKLVSDCADWYGTRDRDLLYKMVKGFDTFLRMRWLNKHVDGVIAISEYLRRFYCGALPVLRLPPLVDMEEPKWKTGPHKDGGRTTLIFAGSPSREKERLDHIVQAVLKLSGSNNISLKVIGIGKDEFMAMYGTELSGVESGETVRFLGRMDHVECLRHVMSSDYSLIIRDRTRVAMAGFPTKFVESVSCGVPVIATDSSDLAEYIESGVRNGYLVEMERLEEALAGILDTGRKIQVDSLLFDYRNYLKPFEAFLNEIGALL